MYQIVETTFYGERVRYIKTDDMIIPFDDGNTQYREYKAWCDSGNVAEVLDLTPAPQPKQFTALDVIKLFTRQENLAIVTATMTNPEAKMWYDRLLAANYVVISDPDTAAGLETMVQAGLLTSARKAEIIAALS